MRVHPPRSPPFPYTTLFRSRAYALRFAREGAHVVVADIRDEQARAVAAECQALGPAALGARLDVADEASTRRSEEHTSELQSPDQLVCRLLLEKKNKTT